MNACEFTSFVFRPTKDCEVHDSQRQFLLEINDPEHKYTPNMFVWVEKRLSAHGEEIQSVNKRARPVHIEVTYPHKDVPSDTLGVPNIVEGHVSEDISTGAIMIVSSGEAFKAALNAREQALQEGWKALAAKPQNNKKWIMEEANVKYHGGIYAECAWSMMDYFKENAGWILGPMAASAALGAQLSLSMAILGGFFPVTIAGVVAATTWGFRRQREKHIQKKFNPRDQGMTLNDIHVKQENALNQKVVTADTMSSFPDIGGAKSSLPSPLKQSVVNGPVTAYTSRANAEIDNLFDFEEDGQIIEYDFFTGERIFDDDGEFDEDVSYYYDDDAADEAEYGFLYDDYDANEDLVFGFEKRVEPYYPPMSNQMYPQNDGGVFDHVDGRMKLMIALLGSMFMFCCFCGAFMCVFGVAFGYVWKKRKMHSIFELPQEERNDNEDI